MGLTRKKISSEFTAQNAYGVVVIVTVAPERSDLQVFPAKVCVLTIFQPLHNGDTGVLLGRGTPAGLVERCHPNDHHHGR